jgi:hypothetical protein
VRGALSRTASNGGPPAAVNRRWCVAPKPDVVLENQYVVVAARRDDLPNFYVRPRDRYLLPRHPNRLIGTETLLQPRIRLDIQLVTDAITRIDVRGCGYGATVPSVHRCEPSRDRHQRRTVERSKPTELAEYTPPPLWLSIQVYD